MGVKSTIIKMPKGSKVRELFGYFKKKVRNFNKNEFYFIQEQIQLTSLIDGKPIRFNDIPVPLDHVLGDLKNSMLIMCRKVYTDNLLDDNQLLTRNQNKLNIIKSYDTSLVNIRRSTVFSDPSEYRSVASAKFYEVRGAHQVFQVRRIGQGQTRTNFMLGIDFEYLYIIQDSLKKLNGTGEPAEGAASVAQKTIKPNFYFSDILEYQLIQGSLLQLIVKRDEHLGREVYMLEGEKIRQIFNKIDFIRRHLYQSSGSLQL